MKLTAPDYYLDFHCTADKCRHTCCAGWEVGIDEVSLARFSAVPEIAKHIENSDTPHFRLGESERCPFLNAEGLCNMILSRGEDFLCQTCRDHPRFRSFWTDRTELGLGLVCEEAARLILSAERPPRTVLISDDGEDTPMPEDEEWLFELRRELMSGINEKGPRARLREYLIYRHLPDALYDGRPEARIAFIGRAYDEICGAWEKTDGSIDALAECARAWSYDVEYDDEELIKRLDEAEEELCSEK